RGPRAVGALDRREGGALRGGPGDGGPAVRTRRRDRGAGGALSPVRPRDQAGRAPADVTALETDVLVVGYGCAGAAAAITAADVGADVVVVEKTPAGGGNCRYAGGFLWDVSGPAAVRHVEALCGGLTDREVIEAYVDGLHGVRDWVAELGREMVVFVPPDI